MSDPDTEVQENKMKDDKKTENETLESCNIITQLFDMELEEILQKIFLFLEPKSLKNAKSTCSLWCDFVKRRIWHSKFGLAQLNTKLSSQWKQRPKDL